MSLLLDAEEWRSITAVEGYYEVSNLARIRSIPNPARPKVKEPRIMKSILTPQGYWGVRYRKGNIRATRLFLCHREFAKAFIPNPNNLPEVNHINGIKTDNRPENLEWCTHIENVRHAFRTGLVASGEARQHSKLTDGMVREIRKKYIPRTYSQYRLAREYGVSQTVIGQMLMGKTWKEVK